MGTEPARVCYMAAFGITEGYSEEEDWTRFESAMEAMDDAMEGADSEAYEAAEAEAKEAAEVIKGKWIEGKKKMMNANDDSKEDQELNKVCDPNPKKPKDTMADFGLGSQTLFSSWSSFELSLPM